jgi:hypothetical protein
MVHSEIMGRSRARIGGVDGGSGPGSDLAAGAFLREAALIEADPAAIACAKLLN